VSSVMRIVRIRRVWFKWSSVMRIVRIRRGWFRWSSVVRIVRVRRYPRNTPPLVWCASHPIQVGTVRRFWVVTVVTVKNTVFLMTPCSLMKISETAASIVRTEYCLFGCNAVLSSGHLWTCTRNVLPLFSEQKM